jgi:hypothetical protein
MGLILFSLRSRGTANLHRVLGFVFKKKIADGRHHRLEPDLWLKSQTAVAAHTLDLLKINQPSSEGDTHDGSTATSNSRIRSKTSSSARV